MAYYSLVYIYGLEMMLRDIYNTRNHLSQPAVVSVVVATIKIIITMII